MRSPLRCWWRARRPLFPQSRSIADDIGGVVIGPGGPEAGVWVIAETEDLGTKFRKIVVTDDRGRFVVPDLPKAKYQLWVRGYGLVDSTPVGSTVGRRLTLTAVPAPTPRAAAEVYPSNYWLSLIHLPAKNDSPAPALQATASRRTCSRRSTGSTT